MEMSEKAQKILLFSALSLAVLTAAFLLFSREKTISIKLEGVPLHAIIKDDSVLLGLNPANKNSFEAQIGKNGKFEEMNDGFCQEFNRDVGTYRLCQTAGLYGSAGVDYDHTYYDEAQWLEIKPYNLKLLNFLKGREELNKIDGVKELKIYISSAHGEEKEYMTLHVTEGKIDEVFWIKR